MNLEEQLKRISDKIPSFYLKENYFSNLIEKLEDKECNDINKLGTEHIFLVEEFAGRL